MDYHYSNNRKIDPNRKSRFGNFKPDGTPNDNDRVEIGPTQLSFDEWQQANISIPHLPTMRKQRLDRLTAEINKRELAGILLFDPLNIRFASDAPNMQIWNANNFFRACFVSYQGYMIVWDYRDDLLTAHNRLIRETRSGASFFYFASGDGALLDAQIFAKEIKSVLYEYSPNREVLAIDKIMPQGYQAMLDEKITMCDGEEVMEKTRAIKQSEEVKAIQCAVHSCEQGMWKMKAQLQPGLTENDIWSVLHAENIKRGGEWIETRLLASGARTNPWFQECGPRVMKKGELLSFDTDLIGCYGMCVDISRCWLIGDDAVASKEQKELYTKAYQHIRENSKLLAPGVPFRELTFGGHLLEKKYTAQRYCVKMHGVGLCDEWPSIYYPEDYKEGFDYQLREGMVISIEAYIGEVGGKEGVKLEEQFLITKNGSSPLSSFPFEEKLLLF